MSARLSDLRADTNRRVAQVEAVSGELWEMLQEVPRV